MSSAAYGGRRSHISRVYRFEKTVENRGAGLSSRAKNCHLHIGLVVLDTFGCVF